MLSSNFIKDSGSGHLIAPIVSFKIEKNLSSEDHKDGEDYELVAMTPLPDKFLNMILEYTGFMF
jgi:hypothetical protein